MKIKNESTPSEQPETGMANLVCCGIVDMGTQPSALFAPRREIAIFFETVDQRRQEGELAGQPFRLRITCNRSMHPKSGLVKTLEGWRGKAFTAEEHELHKTDGYDVGKLIGIPAVGNLVTNEKGYVNISSLAKAPRTLAAKPTVNWYLDLDAFDLHDWEDLPDFIKEKVKKSPEYADAIRPKRNAVLTNTQADPLGDPDDLDTIPF